MKIGVDVMGSDLGPKELLKSCLRFVNENDVQLVIYGNQEDLDFIKNLFNSQDESNLENWN